MRAVITGYVKKLALLLAVLTATLVLHGCAEPPVPTNTPEPSPQVQQEKRDPGEAGADVREAPLERIRTNQERTDEQSKDGETFPPANTVVPKPGDDPPQPTDTPPSTTAPPTDATDCVPQEIGSGGFEILMDRSIAQQHADALTKAADCLSDKEMIRLVLIPAIDAETDLKPDQVSCLMESNTGGMYRRTLRAGKEDALFQAALFVSMTSLALNARDCLTEEILREMTIKSTEMDRLQCIVSTPEDAETLLDEITGKGPEILNLRIQNARDCLTKYPPEPLIEPLPDCTKEQGEAGLPCRFDPRQATLKAMYQLEWMKDGTTRAEQETADRLEALSRYNPELALRVVGMPFLESHDHTDTGAVSALAHISYRDPGAALRVADHPSLAGGITDEDTTAVTLTHGEFMFGGNPERFLGRNAPTAHTFAEEMPLSGTVAVTVAAPSGEAAAAHTATQVHRNLAWLEVYLDQPLATSNVVIHYGSTLPGVAKGANVQTTIMQPAHH